MRLYVWENLLQLTGWYHSSGSAMAVAEDEKTARKLILKCVAQWENPEADERARGLPFSSSISDEEPSVVFELQGEVEPRAWVFPNAGCC